MSSIGPRILYCDATCVAVNKIAGEAVEGAGKGMVCLPNALAVELAKSCYMPPARNALPLPTAVHRLDVPISGCALFARSVEALRFLNAAFSQGIVEKRYWAIVETPKNNFTLDQFLENSAPQNIELVHWIQFDSRQNKSTAHDHPKPGRKKAVLRYSFVGKGRDYLFLETELVTGRHHQIRAQFARIGLHIKGDLKYSARRSEKNGGIRLHARTLSFPDFTSGKRITVHAEVPMHDNLWQAFQSASGQPDAYAPIATACDAELAKACLAEC